MQALQLLLTQVHVSLVRQQIGCQNLQCRAQGAAAQSLPSIAVYNDYKQQQGAHTLTVISDHGYKSQVTCIYRLEGG